MSQGPDGDRYQDFLAASLSLLYHEMTTTMERNVLHCSVPLSQVEGSSYLNTLIPSLSERSQHHAEIRQIRELTAASQQMSVPFSPGTSSPRSSIPSPNLRPTKFISVKPPLYVVSPIVSPRPSNVSAPPIAEAQGKHYLTLSRSRHYVGVINVLHIEGKPAFRASENAMSPTLWARLPQDISLQVLPVSLYSAQGSTAASPSQISLTCRVWARHLRPFLFQSLSLRTPRDLHFLATILTSELSGWLAAHVEKVYSLPGPDWAASRDEVTRAWRSLLRRCELPRLYSLRIIVGSVADASRTNQALAGRPPSMRPCPRSLRSLTTLELCQCRFYSFSSFLRNIGTLEHLAVLFLQEVSWDGGLDLGHPPSCTSRFPSLRCIRLFDDFRDPLSLTWIFAGSSLQYTFTRQQWAQEEVVRRYSDLFTIMRILEYAHHTLGQCANYFRRCTSDSETGTSTLATSECIRIPNTTPFPLEDIFRFYVALMRPGSSQRVIPDSSIGFVTARSNTLPSEAHSVEWSVREVIIAVKDVDDLWRDWGQWYEILSKLADLSMIHLILFEETVEPAEEELEQISSNLRGGLGALPWTLYQYRATFSFKATEMFFDEPRKAHALRRAGLDI